MNWQNGQIETLEYTGNKVELPLISGLYKITAKGAKGNNGFSCVTSSCGTVGSGGSGGFLEALFFAKKNDLLEIWVGEGEPGRGSDGYSGFGGWGRNRGGRGGYASRNQAPTCLGQGGHGAGSTEVDINGSFLCSADGGGGEGAGSSGDCPVTGGGGGRGGLGNQNGEGSGFGGNGGGEFNPAGDGGQEISALAFETLTTTTGGSNTINGEVTIEAVKLRISPKYYTDGDWREIEAKYFDGTELTEETFFKIYKEGKWIPE